MSCWSHDVQDGVCREVEGVDRVLADIRAQRLDLADVALVDVRRDLLDVLKRDNARDNLVLQ